MLQTKTEADASTKLLLGAAIAWLIATVFCKLAIIWFYTCIFSTGLFKKLAHILMLGVIGYGISFLVYFTSHCHPEYDDTGADIRHCKDPFYTIEELTCVSVNMLIDILIIILPMRPLWGLQMATKRKLGISVLFSLGLL